MFSNLYPPVISGSSTHVSRLAKELSQRGHDVVVITAKINQALPDHEEVDGVNIFRLPAVHLPKLPIALNFPWLNYTFTHSNFRSITNIIRLHRPDVLHTHNHMFDLAISAALMQKRWGLPLVITIHTEIKHSRQTFNWLLYPADRIVLKNLIIRKADGVICPDVNIRRYVQEAFGVCDGIIIPYGIDIPKKADASLVSQLKSQYRLDGNRVILSLGHVHDIRDRKDLVEALPEVLNAFPNTVLLIVGAISTSKPMDIARRLGVNAAVIFTGPKPHDQISAFFELADIEAHWVNQYSSERTSLGIASLEAMAAGKTVLAAANQDSYGIGLLESGVNIEIVEAGKPHQLAQTIIGLLQDKDRCRAIGNKAHLTIRDHFSWDSVCNKTLQVYQRVIDNKSSYRPNIGTCQ